MDDRARITELLGREPAASAAPLAGGAGAAWGSEV